MCVCVCVRCQQERQCDGKLSRRHEGQSDVTYQRHHLQSQHLQHLHPQEVMPVKACPAVCKPGLGRTPCYIQHSACSVQARPRPYPLLHTAQCLQGGQEQHSACWVARNSTVPAGWPGTAQCLQGGQEQHGLRPLTSWRFESYPPMFDITSPKDGYLNKPETVLHILCQFTSIRRHN